MVTHRAAETAFYAALEEISALDFMRAPARAIGWSRRSTDACS